MIAWEFVGILLKSSRYTSSNSAKSSSVERPRIAYLLEIPYKELQQMSNYAKVFLMKSNLKVMTILGTRPEIIRLAAIIKKLDKFCNHILVHTGQNYDYELNKVFFEDLDLREPDIQLAVKSDTLHGQIANILRETGEVLERERPDAVLVLGDTNSALSLINAKRLKIPIFHMEAGDRSFDENVPEELNRRIVDSISDVVIAYTEYSRRNLLREGIHPEKIYVSGSPIREVYVEMMPKFKKSKILKELKLTPKKFFTASIHREENVDIP